MNKKMKRITLIAASSALLVPTIGVSTLALTNAIIKNNSTHDNASILDTSQDIYKYLYQGKYYNSYDDIVQNILWSNRDTINQQMYYGNLNKAIFDLETKRIDIGQMRPFEWANQNGRLEAAWINALGQHTRSYEEAKSSFINKGLVKHEYVDMFGNLHYTYDNALASNQRGVKFDELAYYKIKNEKNETININPLNKKDIKEFTRIALNSLGNNSESNPFKLIFLEEQKNQKNTNTKSFVNVSNDLFLNSSYNKISQDLFDIINNSIIDWILNLRINVKLSLLNKTDILSNHYSFNTKSSDRNFVESLRNEYTATKWQNIHERRDGLIKNIKIKDLSIFKPFLEHEYFNDTSSLPYINIKKTEQKVGLFQDIRSIWAEVTLSKELWSDLPNGSKPNQDIVININCEGDNLHGAFGGANVDIMYDGTANTRPQLYFAVEVENNEYFNKEVTGKNSEGFLNLDKLFKKDANNKSIFTEITKKYIDSKNYETSYKDDLKNIIDLINDYDQEEDVEINFEWVRKNLRDYVFEEGIKSNFIKNLYKPYIKNDMLFSKQWTQDINIFNKVNNELYEGYDDNGNIFINDHRIEQIFKSEINLDKYDTQDKIKQLFINYFNKYLVNYKLKKCIPIVTFKNSPIFSLNATNYNSIIYNDGAELGNIIFEEINKFYNTDIDEKIDIINNVSGYNWTFENNYYSYSFENINNPYIVDTKYDGNRLIFDVEEKSEYLPNDWSAIDKNHQSQIEQGFYGALIAYNHNIKNMTNDEYRSYQDMVENTNNKFDNIIQPNEILVLRNYSIENDYFKNETTYFAKYLRSYSFSQNLFNPSFLDNIANENKIAINSIIEENIRKNATYSKPSQIVVVYDLNGKIINPGINSDGIADTSNPALYDSEQNVIDNLLKATIVKKDPKMSYYREDDGTYTLIENTTNFVYKLFWDNKTNYFATYNDARNYLRDIIKLDTIKVKI